MNHISSYSKIHTVGHRLVQDLFDGHIVIEEKVDGSQFSFGVIEGKLFCRSKGQELFVDAPEKMFCLAVSTAKRLFAYGKLVEGWTYRCEYLNKPKHNTLAYSRVPIGHLVILDIEMLDRGYVTDPINKLYLATMLGLECVPCFYKGPGTMNGKITSPLANYFDKESFLGGCKIEGVVIKNYSKFTEDDNVMMGKFVSAEFKEKHQHQWKASNPGAKDFVESLIVSLTTEARWRKAIQHLRERGELKVGPEDIGPLIREIQKDVLEEEGDAIRASLFDHFSPQIARGVIRGFPDFYKNELCKNQNTES